jgi:hypothetical protein
VVRLLAGCWKFKVGRRQFTDRVRRQALRQHAAQLHLVGTTCVARPFAEHFFATGGAKLLDLCANALIVRSYPASRRSYRPPFDFKAVPCLATVINICNSGYMDNLETIAALAALAQSTRLDAFRRPRARDSRGDEISGDPDYRLP